MIYLHGVVLFLAAVFAGALNSVAGGGSFISFPALLATGVPAINANATNTLALWPGSLASAIAYRKELRPPRHIMVTFGVASLVGGLLGALLLLRTPEATFLHLLPFLMLFATLLFTFGGRVTARLRQRSGHVAASPWLMAIGLGARTISDRDVWRFLWRRDRDRDAGVPDANRDGKHPRHECAQDVAECADQRGRGDRLCAGQGHRLARGHRNDRRGHHWAATAEPVSPSGSIHSSCGGS